MSRKYAPIWERIKLLGSCTIAVHPSLHARVKKAVCKEKNADIGYKLLWGEVSDKLPELCITHDSKNRQLITFTLIKPVTLNDL